MPSSFRTHAAYPGGFSHDPHRNDLLLAYTPLVRKIARKMERKSHGLVSADDLAQEAYLRLLTYPATEESHIVRTSHFAMVDAIRSARRGGMTVNGGPGWNRSMETTPESLSAPATTNDGDPRASWRLCRRANPMCFLGF